MEDIDTGAPANAEKITTAVDCAPCGDLLLSYRADKTAPRAGTNVIDWLEGGRPTNKDKGALLRHSAYLDDNGRHPASTCAFATT